MSRLWNNTGKQSHMSQSEGQVSIMVKCSRPSHDVSPMKLVFGRNPEIPGNLLCDIPEMIANSSFLHDRDAGRAARVRTVARTKLMMQSDKLSARRALDTRPRVVLTFLPGDMVAVRRLGEGRWSPKRAGQLRIVMASLEQLMPASREEKTRLAIGRG